MTTTRQYDLEDRLLRYAAEVIRLTEHLSEGKAAAHVGGQLLRSATSPLSNHAEAQAAESPQDFIHKLKISLKELRESKRWLLLIRLVPLVTPPSAVDAVLQETEELIKIFVASIKTSEKRRLAPTAEGME
jgi:four helix bundle protein